MVYPFSILINQQSMENYNLILQEFNQAGIEEQQTLDQYEVNHALDTIYQKNIHDGGIFNRDVSEEIFQQTQKQNNNRIVLKHFINKILQAHRLLKKFITESKAKCSSLSGRQKQEELQLLAQYEQDYYLLTAPFKITPLQSTHKQNQKKMNKSNLSSVFSQKTYEQSSSLKIVFILGLGCFLLQFFMMFVKHHFLSMMTYLAILSIFFLNYFDKTFIRLALYMLAGSIFFDLLWVILQADHYWNVGGSSHHYSSGVGFMRFVYIITIILMIVKGAIIFLLLKYRANDEQTCKTVKLLNFKFQLSAQKESPISTIIREALKL